MAPKWECTKCLEDNSDSEEVCEWCDTAREDADPVRLAQRAAREAAEEAARDAAKEAAKEAARAARERYAGVPGGYAPTGQYFPPFPPPKPLHVNWDEKETPAALAAEWARERRSRLVRELSIVDFCGAAERRSRLRALQLELHPDKHDQDRQPHAQEMFLLVQSRWEEDEKGRKQRKQAEARKEEERLAEEERQRQREAAREAARAREAALRRQRDAEEAEQKRRLEAARAAAEREERRRAEAAEGGFEAPAPSDQAQRRLEVQSPVP